MLKKSIKELEMLNAHVNEIKDTIETLEEELDDTGSYSLNLRKKAILRDLSEELECLQPEIVNAQNAVKKVSRKALKISRKKLRYKRQASIMLFNGKHFIKTLGRCHLITRFKGAMFKKALYPIGVASMMLGCGASAGIAGKPPPINTHYDSTHISPPRKDRITMFKQAKASPIFSGDIPTLTYKDIRLRPPHLKDETDIERGASYFDMVAMREIAHPIIEGTTRGFLKHVISHTRSEMLWVIEACDNAQFLGLISLASSRKADCELGYWIHPHFWRRGIATRSARLLKNENPLNARHIAAACLADNIASATVLLNIGFREIMQKTNTPTRREFLFTYPPSLETPMRFS